MRITTESTIFAEHDRTSVHAYIREDLNAAQGVGFDVFLEVVFGLTPSTVSKWVSVIRKKGWHNDETIAMSLSAFSLASQESHRYQPLATIANRVMAMAHGQLPGVPATYPIDDICVRRNDPVCVQPVGTFGQLGAKRIPDLLTLREIHAKYLQRPSKSKPAPGVKWVHDIFSWELKAGKAPSDLLKAFLKDRDAGSIGPSDDGRSDAIEDIHSSPPTAPSTPKNRRAAQSTKFRREVADSSDPDSDEPVQAGVKRRAHNDLTQDIRKPDPPGGIFYLNTEERAPYAAKEASKQAGSYALETLACTFGTRLFCVNVILRNDMLYLWYYDACGFVYTQQGISLISDFEKAAALIVGMACCTPERLGALPAVIEPPLSAPYPDNWPPPNLTDHTLTLRKTVTITLKEPVFTQYVISGRRTFVYAMEANPAISEEELIIKLSYQVETRRREHDLVAAAREAEVGHLPTIHMWDDLWKMSDGVRRIFLSKGGVEYENRTLRAIIYTRYLPLESLVPKSPESIPLMAYQMLDCLHDLRYKANILHRDISINNVMYEHQGDCLHFVLIDFDMATVLPKKGTPYVPSSKHRTGTLPFMAIELIQNAARSGSEDYFPIDHLFRHDVESIFWLSLWSPMVLMEPENDAERKQQEHNMAIVRAWETGDLESIVGRKTVIRKAPLEDNDITLLGRAKCLESWFDEWTGIWIDVDHALSKWARNVSSAKRRGQPPPEFDKETAGGLFSRDRLKETLTKVFPDVQVCAEPKSEAATTTTKADHGSLLQEADPVERHTAADADGNSRRRSTRNAGTTTRKVTSQKAGTVAGKRGTTNTVGRRKKPSTPVKQAEIKRVVKTAAKKAVSTKKTVSAKKKMTVKKAATTKTTKTTAMKKTAAPRKAETAAPRKASNTTRRDRIVEEPSPQEDRAEENLDENDIRRRLRPRKRN